MNQRNPSGKLRLQRAEIKNVEEFKYLGLTVQGNRECGKEVKKCLQEGWNGWRKVSGVMCDKKSISKNESKRYARRW